MRQTICVNANAIGVTFPETFCREKKLLALAKINLTVWIYDIYDIDLYCSGIFGGKHIKRYKARDPEMRWGNIFPWLSSSSPHGSVCTPDPPRWVHSKGLARGWKGIHEETSNLRVPQWQLLRCKENSCITPHWAVVVTDSNGKGLNYDQRFHLSSLEQHLDWLKNHRQNQVVDQVWAAQYGAFWYWTLTLALSGLGPFPNPEDTNSQARLPVIWIDHSMASVSTWPDVQNSLLQKNRVTHWHEIPSLSGL